MKWDDIKIFDACMRLGSLSAAAQSLDVQQSTVSRRVQALEDNLGGALFIRTSEGIVPTSLAEKLAGEASAMQLHFHALERLASGSASNEEEGRPAVLGGEAADEDVPLREKQEVLEAAELVAFDVLEQALRSRFGMTERSVAASQFREEIE